MKSAETESRKDAEKIENLLSEQILDAAIEVHRTLGGPGLLESLYEDALFQVRNSSEFWANTTH